MIKFIVDLFQIAIAIRLIYVIFKWFFFKKKSSRKSIIWKVSKLTSNRVHYFLNNRLDKQRKAMELEKAYKDGKVIPLRKTE